MLRLFVRRGLFEAVDAQGMLALPHSGFHVHDGVWVPDGDMDFAKRLARYCARNPVALERLAYDGPGAPVHYRSDKRDGPTAGTETVDPLEFLARLVTHIPNKHQVMTRYYGWYANRPRGTWRKATPDAGVAPITVAEPEALPLREARRRWAELLRRIYEVDPLTCPACGGAMRILAFLTERAVIDRILSTCAGRGRTHGGHRPRGGPRAARSTRSACAFDPYAPPGAWPGAFGVRDAGNRTAWEPPTSPCLTFADSASGPRPRTSLGGDRRRRSRIGLPPSAAHRILPRGRLHFLAPPSPSRVDMRTQPTCLIATPALDRRAAYFRHTRLPKRRGSIVRIIGSLPTPVAGAVRWRSLMMASEHRN